jgi:hypothetical protein
MNGYTALADLIVVLHFLYALFVVGAMAPILIGIVFRWAWVRSFSFRVVHLAMIAAVVVQPLLGIGCPLTVWEDRLREAAGTPVEDGTFIGRWAHRLLFVDVPIPTMQVYYAIFGLAVLLAFVLAPPRWPWKSRKPK